MTLHSCPIQGLAPAAVAETKPRSTLFVHRHGRVRSSRDDCCDKPRDGRLTASASCRAAIHQSLGVAERVSVGHVGVQLLEPKREVLHFMVLPRCHVLDVGEVGMLACALLARLAFAAELALTLAEGLAEVHVLALAVGFALSFAFPRRVRRRSSWLSLLHRVAETSILPCFGHGVSSLLERNLRLIVQIRCLLFLRA